MAARALGRFVTSPIGRQTFEQNNYTSGSQLLLALESDLVADVIARARRYPPPVTAAVYYSDIDQFRFISFEPTPEPGEGESERLGAGISIGMLLDATRPDRDRFKIDDGWAMPIRAHGFSSI
jgi:hypothetical protein